MLDSVSNTPLIDIKGENLNLIQINFDFWDVSTRKVIPVERFPNVKRQMTLIISQKN